MEITLITREDVDKTKWNSCVHYASNGEIYGYTWYLDNISKNWMGLVEGDYESVLPLFFDDNSDESPQIIQPNLVRALSIYSIRVLSKKRITEFLKAIPQSFEIQRLCLKGDLQTIDENRFRLEAIPNYSLWLNQPYESLHQAYSEELKAVDFPKHWKLTSSIKPEQIADFYKKHDQSSQGFHEPTFHALHRIMYNALHRGLGSASAVLDDKGGILAVNFYLLSHSRAISLIPVAFPNQDGRQALTFLFEIFVRLNAGRPMSLDFNSSASFYQKFGANNLPAYQITTQH